MTDPKDPKHDTAPGKAKSLIGKGHNVSVRSLQRAGLAKPSGTSAADSSSARVGESQRLKALAAIEDSEGYVPKPVEVLLLKDLARQKPDQLKARLAGL